MSTVDLNDLPANATLSIAREETASERAVRLFKDVTLFLAALVFVGIIHRRDQPAHAPVPDHQRR